MIYTDSADLYDTINAIKDYRAEVEFILNCYAENSPLALERVLDVGSGSGGHAEHLGRSGFAVTGVDISEEMVKIANAKQMKNCSFENFNICMSPYPEEFELIVSMFHVVNHLITVEELECFFQNIHATLKQDGVFIFDCINGDAAFLDAPQDFERQYEAAGKTVIQKSRALFEKESLFLQMRNTILIDGEETAYSLEQTLHRPRTYRSLLAKAGLTIVGCKKSHLFNSAATEADYKIAFICKKAAP